MTHTPTHTHTYIQHIYINIQYQYRICLCLLPLHVPRARPLLKRYHAITHYRIVSIYAIYILYTYIFLHRSRIHTELSAQKQFVFVSCPRLTLNITCTARQCRLPETVYIHTISHLQMLALVRQLSLAFRTQNSVCYEIFWQQPKHIFVSFSTKTKMLHLNWKLSAKKQTKKNQTCPNQNPKK